MRFRGWVKFLWTGSIAIATLCIHGATFKPSLAGEDTDAIASGENPSGARALAPSTNIPPPPDGTAAILGPVVAQSETDEIQQLQQEGDRISDSISAQPEDSAETNDGWRFSLQPYILVPFFIDADLTTEFEIPINFDIPIQVEAEVPFKIGARIPTGIEFTTDRFGSVKVGRERLNAFTRTDIEFGRRLGRVDVGGERPRTLTPRARESTARFGQLNIGRDTEVTVNPKDDVIGQESTLIPVSAVVVGEETIPIEINLGDLLSLDKIFTASGRVEAWNGKFGIILNGYYALLEDKVDIDVGPVSFGPVTIEPLVVSPLESETLGPLEIDEEIVASATIGPVTLGEINSRVTASFDLGYVDLAGAYHIGDAQIGNTQMWFEPMGGLRVNFVDIDIKFQPGSDKSRSEVYLEPLLGGRIGLRVDDLLSISLIGDVSGFGIDSDLTWNVIATLDWRLRHNISLLTGYQIYALSFEDRSGDNLGLDLTEHSIHLGLSFRF